MMAENALMRGLGQDPRFDYDVFGHIIQKPYTATSPIKASDPFAQQMNAQYKYTAPDLQPTAFVEGGPGWDIFKGKYGSWDLGKKFSLIPKQDQRYLLDQNNPLQDGTHGFLQLINSKTGPTNPDGTINPNGWMVASRKSGAMNGVLGTLGVLGAAAGASFWGPSASQTASSALSSGAGMAIGGGNALSSSLTGSTPITARKSSGGRGVR